MTRALICWLVVRAAYRVTVLAVWVVRRLEGTTTAYMLNVAKWDLDSASCHLKRWI